MTASTNSLTPKAYFIKDVEQLTRRNRQTLRRMWYKNLFPKPTLLNNRSCWKSEVIHQWIQENI